MIRSSLAALALAAAFLATPARAQEAELVVTFDRATRAYEAQDLIQTVAPRVQTFGDGFSSLYVSAQFDAPPPPQALGALFEDGAVSVEVVRLAAQLAALAPFDMEELEAHGVGGGYLVRVGYASTTPTDEATAAFASALGVEPAGAEKRANEIRFRVPEPTAPSVADRLRSSSGVVAVRVE